MACNVVVLAYNRGDSVQMSKRITYKGMVSAWHDVPFTNSPVFGERSSWAVPGASFDVRLTTETKLSFSFEHETFTTPWLTLQPNVNVIRFRFMHSGNDIVDMKTEQYADDDRAADIIAKATKLQNLRAAAAEVGDAATESPENEEQKLLTLVYEWEEVSPMDQNSALNVLFFSSFVLTLLLAAAVVMSLPVEWEMPPIHGAPAKRHARRAQ